MLLNLVAELPETEPEKFGSPRLDALGPLEGFFEDPALDLVERGFQVESRLGKIQVNPARLALAVDRLGERLRRQHLPCPEDEGPLHHVFEFPDVSRPVVLLEQPERLRRHAPNFLAELFPEFLEEVGHEERDVLTPLAE